jgi:hypothetical protein
MACSKGGNPSTPIPYRGCKQPTGDSFARKKGVRVFVSAEDTESPRHFESLKLSDKIECQVFVSIVRQRTDKLSRGRDKALQSSLYGCFHLLGRGNLYFWVEARLPLSRY